MFERYSEHARRVLFFARYELGVLGGDTIEPAHVLLGLLRGSKQIERMLANGNIPVSDVRLKIEQRVPRGARFPNSVEVPFAPATIRVLNLSAEEADRLLHPSIEPEHLLLALLREDDPVAAATLAAYGMDLDGTREYLASRPAVVSKEPHTQVVPSQNPLVTGHIERIAQLVRDLAQTEPNTAEAQALIGRIDDELMMLTLLFD